MNARNPRVTEMQTVPILLDLTSASVAMVTAETAIQHAQVRVVHLLSASNFFCGLCCELSFAPAGVPVNRKKDQVSSSILSISKKVKRKKRWESGSKRISVCHRVSIPACFKVLRSFYHAQKFLSVPVRHVSLEEVVKI